MKLALLLVAIVLLALPTAQAQPAKWQVGVDAQFVFALYQATDPGHVLKSVFSAPTATGRFIVDRSLNERGLFVESGLGYRQVPQATALQSHPFNGVSTTNGIGLWYLPVGLRQDLTTLLFPRHVPKFRLAIKTGILHQLATSEGVEHTTFSETGAGLKLSGHSTLGHHYSLAVYTGLEIRFAIRRVDLLLQWGQVYGLSDILTTQIDYQLNGVSTQASIRNAGSALNGIGVGLRYHFDKRQ